jgi:hypothetical protein
VNNEEIIGLPIISGFSERPRVEFSTEPPPDRQKKLSTGTASI